MFKLKAYHYFWVTALLILLLDKFARLEINSSDINIHDAYYIIEDNYLAEILPVIYILIGGIYYISSKLNIKLNFLLTLIHTLITISVIYIYRIGVYFILTNKSEFPLFENYSNLNHFTVILVLLTLIAQLLFIINLVVSTFKYFKRKS